MERRKYVYLIFCQHSIGNGQMASTKVSTLGGAFGGGIDAPHVGGNAQRILVLYRVRTLRVQVD
jgi:hypothetical protein